MIDDLQHSDDNAITLSILPCVAMHKCGLCRRAVSVRPSVCLSRPCIVSKSLNISLNFFHHSRFSAPNFIAIFRRRFPNGGVE